MYFNTDETGTGKTNFITFFRTAVVSLFIISVNYLHMNYAQAGEADVVKAHISSQGSGVYRIDVTVRHGDAGWDHYANRWDVLDLDGKTLGSRLLAHPHDNEQPFTRSLTLSLPEGTTVVIIRANDSVHGLGGTTIELIVPKA